MVLSIDRSVLNRESCGGCHVELFCPRHGSGEWDGTVNDNVVGGQDY